MCGIAGIIYGKEQAGPSGDYTLSLLRKMSERLRHRGPDDDDIWMNQRATVGLAHRRLSIIDLSMDARQPMHYLDRYSLVFNGEIYNYLEIKDTLIQLGYRFRTQSDSEVLLLAYVHYNKDCLQYLDGMFAFSIWDEQEQTLFMARDRFGEKPLYYAFNEERFYFASERKAIWACGIEKKVNNPLLLNYIVLGYTQTAIDKTITYYQDLYALPPAHYIVYSRREHDFSLQSYWDLDKQSISSISESAAIEKFNELWSQSISRRLRADVTLGTSLSGGIDSTSVAFGILENQSRSDRTLQSFSAVFPGYERDESAFIEIATRAGSFANHKIVPTVDSCLEDLDELCYYQEEPFISSSIYAQFCVYRLAKENGIKILLDGQGADEMLAGYMKYIPWFLQEKFRKKPLSVYSEMRALKANGLPASFSFKNIAAALFPAQAALQLEKREAHKVLGHTELNPAFKDEYFDRQTLYKPLGLTLNDQLYFNTCQSGLEDLLRYADRNSMAHGRELRLPFLSHELVSFVFSLPAHFKVHEGWTKWLLRKAMDKRIPSEINWRRDKTGYEPPQKLWMQNKQMQERIQAARQQLVDEKVLRSSVLERKIQPQESIAAENADWRYLIAATCMKKMNNTY